MQDDVRTQKKYFLAALPRGHIPPNHDTKRPNPPRGRRVAPPRTRLGGRWLVGLLGCREEATNCQVSLAVSPSPCIVRGRR